MSFVNTSYNLDRFPSLWVIRIKYPNKHDTSKWCFVSTLFWCYWINNTTGLWHPMLKKNLRKILEVTVAHARSALYLFKCVSFYSVHSL